MNIVRRGGLIVSSHSDDPKHAVTRVAADTPEDLAYFVDAMRQLVEMYDQGLGILGVCESERPNATV